jgi:hypothetical protein
VVDAVSSLTTTDVAQLAPWTDQLVEQTAVLPALSHKTVLRPKKAGVEKQGPGRRFHGKTSTTKRATPPATGSIAHPADPAVDLFGHSLGGISAVQAAAIRAIQHVRPYNAS